jgi:beta-lactamase regulating signal transducer with metallopeptidase domain
VDTLLEIGLSNALVATLLAIVVALIGKACCRPALVHTLWLLVLLKLVTPAPLALSITLPSPLEASKDFAPVNEDSGLQASILDLQSSILNAAPVLLTIWLAGSACWFALAAFRTYRFARLLRFGRRASLHLQDQADQLAVDLGMEHGPDVWLMPGMLSPMLWGLGRSTRLLLPADLVERLDSEQLRTLLAHELAHARRRDPWVRAFELLVLGLYWWHPVAWWARRRLREAEEQCCDAWVVWALPTAASSYATALVETVAFLSSARPALPPVASGVGYVRVLKRRLTLILDGTPPKSLSITGLVAVLGLGLALLPWRPVWGQNEAPDSPPEPAEALRPAPEAPPVEVALVSAPVPPTVEPEIPEVKKPDKDTEQPRRPHMRRGGRPRGDRPPGMGEFGPPRRGPRGFGPGGFGPGGFGPGGFGGPARSGPMFGGRGPGG